MNRSAKSVLGVTLLEIMLVLAIAAMVIVMSVRYYQSASAGQQANATVAQIQSIVSSADSLAQSSGSYSSVSQSAITSVIGGGTSALRTPWGTNITLDRKTNYLQFGIASTPVAVCNLIKAKLGGNNHYSGSATAGTAITCPTSGAADVNIYYISNP